MDPHLSVIVVSATGASVSAGQPCPRPGAADSAASQLRVVNAAPPTHDKAHAPTGDSERAVHERWHMCRARDTGNVRGAPERDRPAPRPAGAQFSEETIVHSI